MISKSCVSLNGDADRQAVVFGVIESCEEVSKNQSGSPTQRRVCADARWQQTKITQAVSGNAPLQFAEHNVVNEVPGRGIWFAHDDGLRVERHDKIDET